MKILCFVTDGSEDCEFVTVVDLLRRAGVDARMCSLGEKQVTLARGIKIEADMTIDEIVEEEYSGLFLPGGLKGFETFKETEELLKLIKRFYISGKLVSAICAAPGVLDKAGILKDNNYTMFSGMEKDNKDGNYIDTGVVVSDNIITGKSLNYSVDLGLALVEYLCGEETLAKVKKGIIRK